MARPETRPRSSGERRAAATVRLWRKMNGMVALTEHEESVFRVNSVEIRLVCRFTGHSGRTPNEGRPTQSAVGIRRKGKSRACGGTTGQDVRRGVECMWQASRSGYMP